MAGRPSKKGSLAFNHVNQVDEFGAYSGNSAKVKQAFDSRERELLEFANEIYDHFFERYVRVTEEDKVLWDSWWVFDPDVIKAVKVLRASDADRVNGKTIGKSVPASANFSNSWYENSKHTVGYVPEGQNDPYKAWGTDAGGNPMWVDIREQEEELDTTGYIVVGTTTEGHTLGQVDFLCDGVNDEVEIKAAIEQASGLGTGVLLLDGNYYLMNNVGLECDDVIIVGQGDSTSINSSEIRIYFSFYSCNDIRIANIRFNGQRFWFSFYSCNDIEIKNIVSNALETDFGFSDCNDIAITYIECSNGDAGFGFDDCDDITMTYIKCNGGDAIFTLGDCDDIKTTHINLACDKAHISYNDCNDAIMTYLDLDCEHRSYISFGDCDDVKLTHANIDISEDSYIGFSGCNNAIMTYVDLVGDESYIGFDNCDDVCVLSNRLKVSGEGSGGLFISQCSKVRALNNAFSEVHIFASAEDLFVVQGNVIHNTKSNWRNIVVSLGGNVVFTENSVTATDLPSQELLVEEGNSVITNNIFDNVHLAEEVGATVQAADNIGLGVV